VSILLNASLINVIRLSVALLNVILLNVSLITVILLNVILLNVSLISVILLIAILLRVALLSVILLCVVLLNGILQSFDFKQVVGLVKKVILRSAIPHFHIYDVRFWVLASPLFAYRRHIELLFSEMRFKKTDRQRKQKDRQTKRQKGRFALF
jgi:hypothetical protein